MCYQLSAQIRTSKIPGRKIEGLGKSDRTNRLWATAVLTSP